MGELEEGLRASLEVLASLMKRVVHPKDTCRESGAAGGGNAAGTSNGDENKMKNDDPNWDTITYLAARSSCDASSQQPSDTPPTADDAGNSLPAGRPSNNAAAPGGVGDEQPANSTSDGDGEPTIDAMEEDRPSTAFNAFGFDGGDEGRPATSGSHGFFGGLNDMFENTNDNEVMMDGAEYYGEEYQQEYDFIPQQDDAMGEVQVESPAKDNDCKFSQIFCVL